MNRIYRLVFNRALGRVQVASELASGSVAGSGAALSSQRQPALRPLWLPLLLALWAPAGLAATLPTGGIWTTGAGNITPSGVDALTVNQTSTKALIDWNSFDISSTGTVNFVVPGSSAVTVNKINSGTPSTIAGLLNGNGQVFLINPAGIMFSSGSSANVGGLVASTMALDGGVANDVYDFQGSAQTGAQIINLGNLTATNGSISLLGAAVTNGGSIQAAQINLMAGNPVRLQLYEPGTGISVYLASISNSPATAFGNSAIHNTGTLQAGAINLQAAVAPGLLPSLINLGGVVTASSVLGNDGSLVVQAHGGGIVQTGNVSAGVTTLYAEGDVTQNSGTLSAGTLQFAGPLRNVTLGSPSNRIGNLGGTVQGNLVVGNSIALEQVAPLNVGGTSTINTGGNAITLTNPNNGFGGAVSLTSGGDARIRNTGALTLGQLDVGSLDATTSGPAVSSALSFGGGSVRGALSATSTGAIFQTGALRVAGATTLQANGDIRFDNPGNAFGGIVSLGGNNAYISDAAMLRFGTLNVGALFARAPQLRLSGPVTTAGYQFYGGDLLLERDTQLTSTVGAVDFGGRVDGAYALGVTGRWSTFAGNIGGATALSSFDTRGVRDLTTIGGNLTTAGNIAFGVTGVRSGNYTVRSTGGSIAVTGALDAETDARGQLTLAALNGVLLGADAGASRRLQSLALKGATVSARGIRVANTLTVDSGSAYTQQGAYDIGGNARFVANGNITLANASNRFGGVLSLDGGAAIVDAASALTLEGIDVDSLRATSVAGLTLADARVAGDATLTGSALSLGTFDIDGDLGAHAGTGGLVFGAGRVGGSLTADSGAAIGQAGALVVAAVASFDAVGAIAVAHAGNRFGGDVGARAGAGVVLRGQDTLRVVDLASGAGSSVDLAGGTLELATAVNTGMGRLTLRSETGALALGHTLGGGAVSLYGANGLVLGADASAAGALALSSGVDIVQTGGRIDAGGTTTLDAGRDMDLRGAGNDFSGRVHMRGRNVALRDSNTLVLGQVDAASLDAQATTIHLAPAMTTSGDQTYRGSVVLDADTALDSASGDIAFTGTVDSTASGRHTLTARAGDGDIRFGGAVGGSHALAGLDADAARIVIGGALTIDDGNGGGTLSLASDRDGITQSAAFQVTGDTRLATNGGAITLTRTDNDFGGEIDLVGAGAVAITDRNALAFGGVSASSLAATSHGALNLGAMTLAGALDARSNGGAITQTGALMVGGASTLAAGIGDITLTHAGNQFAGSVALAGRDITIRAANTLPLGTVDARNLRATADTIALRGDVTTDEDQEYAGAVRLDRDVALAAGRSVAFGGTVDGTHALDINAGGQVGIAGAVGGAGALSHLNIDANLTALGSSLHVTGNLSVDVDTGGITQADAFRVGGASSFNANGADIALKDAGNHFTGAVDLSGRDIAINAANALRLGSVTTGALRASSDGELRLTGMIRADTIDLATAGRFVNDVGSTALDVSGGNGQWRIFLDSPMLNHQFNGLDSGNTALWNTPAFATPTASGNRYLFAYQPLLTVTGANLSKIYGDTVDLSQAYIVSGAMQGVAGAYEADRIGGVLGGAPLITSAGSTAMANVSTTPYALWVGKGSLDSSQAGYALRFIDGTLQVDPRALTITANNGGKTYGQSGGLDGFGSHGLVNGDTVSSVDLVSTGMVATANVGNYLIAASNADGTGLSNYDITYVDGILSIGKAGLTITADSGSKTYGQSLVLAGYSVDGLLNSDAVSSVALGSNGASATANVGGYAITVSNADGTGLSNYDITYVDGVLSIGKAGLTITANDGSRTYGQTGGLAGYNVDGLLHGDTVGKVDLASSGASASANVGNYTITASNADGNGLSNYDITYVNGVLSIGKAGLTITANDARSNIGQIAVLNGHTAEGLLTGDAIDSVVLRIEGDDAGARPGRYAIHAGDAQGARLGNYDIRYRPGTLDIVGVWPEQARQVAREVAANLPALAVIPLAEPSTPPLYRLSEAAIRPVEDRCTSLRGGCLRQPPE
ncbi:filamentous hemagglutinin family protein [Stenotrophomonas rhizophila]|uniref:Filamentous hemagglutinin family protein n=1 Tax=Stenotrophomonas rhizophila TaxID=216778 RepID=A0A498C6T8_9GAMM|nr:MBG domain-containing protein [Stenotrophomonas rhizophila]RLK51974.1 filamentous hemagglutinin family protein [Stenotrophomonas rhizophila]